jgi:hypothetical protein
MTIHGHACAGKLAGSAGAIDPGLSGWLDEWFITCTVFKESKYRFPKDIYMAKDAHNKAAEHHENAAKAHRMAAEHHGKGDHASGKKHSATALDHSGKAHEASKAAHEKSQHQK